MPTIPELNRQSRSALGWSLVAQGDGDAIPLRSFPCIVGRQPGLPARVVHPTVSLCHAQIFLNQGRLFVVDLESRNGTFINGERLTDERQLRAGDLLQFGGAAYRLDNQAWSEISVTCQSEDVGDLALALAQFDKLISDQTVVPHYQPIVDANTGEPFAYEALARSSLFGLDKPAMMFRAAEYFQKEAELSRLLRLAGLACTDPETQKPHLFLNTHPAELRDIKPLLLSLRDIRRMRPEQQITLEVHEAAAVDLATMRMIRMALDDLGMGLAYDDFGAGQARLHELVEARPDFLKFDRQMICGLDSAGADRRQLVESLVQISRQLGIATLAEGVETAGEAQACRSVGFQLMQGYFYGRPAKNIAGFASRLPLPPEALQPPPVAPRVEVAPRPAASPSTFARAAQFLGRLWGRKAP
ncbi:MAG: EAL domain-containing protein [Pirellulaceae bacterium]|nr:EAL domain-containing protein [Pirellulaceae bacterium]